MILVEFDRGVIPLAGRGEIVEPVEQFGQHERDLGGLRRQGGQ